MHDSDLSRWMHETTAHLKQIISNQREIMATTSQILTAEQQQESDIQKLAGLLTQVLTQAAADQLSPSDAQALLTEIQAGDQSVNAMVTSANNYLNPPAATPPTPAPTGTGTAPGAPTQTS